MKNLFLIDGDSGSGRSDLVDYIRDFGSELGYFKKYTTRPQRESEKHPESVVDLVFISKWQFDELRLDYKYTYSGYQYGFSRGELNQYLKQYSNVFIIVRSADVIRQLSRDYHFINVVPVYIHTDRQKLVARLKKLGITAQNREFSLRRSAVAYDDFIANHDLYREVLINNTDRDDYRRIIDRLIDKYADEPYVNEKLVFVFMSFGPMYDEYYHAIKRAVELQDKSMICQRLDEVHGAYEISKKALETIRGCRLAVMDLTGNSPNVYYELGHAQAIGKPCILTQHASSQPLFYAGQYRILRYKSALDLKKLLKAELHEIFNSS